MNGKDIFLGMKYVGEDLIEKAEYGQFPTKAEHTVTQKKRMSIRRSFLIAAIIAMMLLLVGCGIVYVLKMQNLKMDEHTDIVYAVDDDSHIAAETIAVTQQVLTLGGLEGTPAHMAAQEWYDFKQEYDPDHSIITSLQSAGKIPEFPREYDAYNIYTQEMKDKLDEIVDKYDLNLMGSIVSFRTANQLCRALGIENVLNSGSSAQMDITTGTFYECGNLNLGFKISLPSADGEDAVDTWGELYYRRKDCFAEDIATIGVGALIGEDYGTREWNYTTKGGTNVLIVRSSSDWRAWIFCDQPETIVSMMVEARFESYSEDEAGNAMVVAVEMTDRQLELLAENVDFSMIPAINTIGDLTGGAVGSSGMVDGYTVALKSAVSDGYVGIITLGITAPENVVLLDPEQGPSQLDYTNNGILRPVNGTDNGSGTHHWVEDDGDELKNTCNLIVRIECSRQEGDAPLGPDKIWNLYMEDIVREYYDAEKLETITQPLVEGTWTFDLTFEGDIWEVELLQAPITTRSISGLTHQGNRLVPEYQDVEIHSFLLRSMSATIRYDENTYADFTGAGEYIYAVMKDGSRIALSDNQGGMGSKELIAESPIDLNQLDHILLVDGTRLFVVDAAE